MDQHVRQELSRFFDIYRSRTESIVAPLSKTARESLYEELELLRVSIENRLTELGI